MTTLLERPTILAVGKPPQVESDGELREVNTPSGIGKLTPYLIIGMLMAAGLFTIMRWVFDVPIAGDVGAGACLSGSAVTGAGTMEMTGAACWKVWKIPP